MTPNPGDRDEGDPPEELDLPQVRERSVRGTTSVLFGEAVVRAGLALLFVVIFAITLFLAYQRIGTDDWKQTKDLLQIVLPAETALLGAAVGYYYGTRK